MKISQNCLDLIKKWEGFRMDAYLDPVKIPTIGYGTIRYPDGRKVKLGDQTSEPEAESFLKFEVDQMVKTLEKTLAGINLNQNQFDAIVCLCYNIGVGGFQGSTILRKLKEGDFQAAAAAFGLWNKGTLNGVKTALPGLTNRRREERELFEKNDNQGTPLETADSPQDKVTVLEAYRDGDNNVVVALDGEKVVEILVLKSAVKEDLIDILQQYPNAKSFKIAKSEQKIPDGERIEVLGKTSEIPPVADKPTLERALLIRGMNDADDGIKGSDIRELQTRLTDLGYYNSEIDGIFGRGTDDAVRKFQADTMGTSEADGKVGKNTWAKLWGTDSAAPAAIHTPTGTPVPGKNYLLLTKTGQKDTSGCFKLNLQYFKDGQAIDSLSVVSGSSRHQFFRTGKDSQRGSFEPLPEGKWRLSNIQWAGGKDNYSGRVWDSGLGPAKIFLDYVEPGTTRRGNIEIHIDWNKSTSPGTAGCIGINSISDFKKLVTWVRETDPKDLYVNWNLNSVKLP
ncbi:MAG TPA: peptidoglycan-binding protein [Pyrinomonadaceae bacterium]|jgi:lysozyme